MLAGRRRVWQQVGASSCGHLPCSCGWGVCSMGCSSPSTCRHRGTHSQGWTGPFFKISYGTYLIPSLTVHFLLFPFQPPGPDDMLGPPEDDGVVPDAG